MLVVSLYQPWATLVVIGAKQIETRSWHTLHRGEIGIHATQSFPDWAREFADTPTVQNALADFGEELRQERFHRWTAAGGWFPTGQLLGTANLIDCLSTNVCADLTDDGTLLPLPGTLEYAVGDFSRDRYMWLLDTPQALREPVPVCGHQRLWHFREPLPKREVIHA